ncbi:MAG: multiheme c-type cytochrome [bacterium]
MTQKTRTKTIRMSIFVLVILILGVSQLLARPSTRIDPIEGNAQEAGDERMILSLSNESPFQPTSLCAMCHLQFFTEWTKSMHYEAWRDPIFQAMYTNYERYQLDKKDMYKPPAAPVSTDESTGRPERWRNREEENPGKNLTVPVFRIPKKENEISIQIHGDGLVKEGIYGGKVHMNCLKCHAPGADFTKDKDLYLENNIDGIFCDYCHTIVDYTPTEHYVIFWSAIKQGPRQFAATSSHAIEYNQLLGNSIFCQGCHQYENPLGFPVYNTYDEWYHSDYANPASTINCQECHWPKAAGRTGLRSDWRPDVRQHTLGGGHNYDFMLKSAGVEITTDIQGEELYIDVDVTNTKAGHNYPSSNGMRQLLLIVRLKGSSGETLWEGKRVYERVLGDMDGNPTMENWKAYQILTDTTLLPNETRTESFVTTLPTSDDSLYVTAQLFYRLTPEGEEFGTVYMPAPYRIDFATTFIQ